jgi:hypothetical protein
MGLYFFDGTESIYQFKKVPATNIYYEMKEGSWLLTERSTYYYSAGSSTGIPALENGKLSLYPNPFSDRIQVNWSDRYNQLDVEIFQVSGIRMIQTVVQSGDQIGQPICLKESIYTGLVSREKPYKAAS